MGASQSLPNLVDTRACAIGLDVGGTKIAGSVVEFPAGAVRVRRIIPTDPFRGGEPILSDAMTLAEGLMADAAALGLEMLGVGVGVAELVDLEGNVTSAQTIAWRGVPVQASFSRLALAVVESDVRAAALAEAMFGAGRDFKIFAYVSIGTGISCCLVQDGRPYAGARGNALLLASSPWTSICTQCGTVIESVVEDIASGPALVARYNQSGPHRARRGEEVMAAVEAGDPVAIEVIKTAGDSLGTSLGFLINILDPEAVIVGGGLGLAGGLYWSSFVTSTRKHIWSDTNRDLPILPAALGADAGFIGAAAAVWYRQANRKEQEHDSPSRRG